MVQNADVRQFCGVAVIMPTESWPVLQQRLAGQMQGRRALGLSAKIREVQRLLCAQLLIPRTTAGPFSNCPGILPPFPPIPLAALQAPVPVHPLRNPGISWYFLGYPGSHSLPFLGYFLKEGNYSTLRNFPFKPPFPQQRPDRIRRIIWAAWYSSAPRSAKKRRYAAQ